MDEVFKRRVSETIDAYNMLSGVKALLCAFSGGADSTALLLCMREICTERGISVFAAHINHMIRGNEADRDMNHCRDFCSSLGVDFTARCVNVPQIAEHEHMGLEETARRERYRILDEIAAEKGCQRICTAHNSGDNLETVIFNLTRGAGLNGLCGIAPIRGNIIRPLIAISRAEIIGLLRAENADFVTDSTNTDTAYTRNFIRAEIIPLLKAVNPAAEQNVSRMCASLREDSAALEAAAFGENISESDAVLTRKIIGEYHALTGETLEHTHINAAIALIRKGRLWSEITLPRSVRLVITRGGRRLERIAEAAPPDNGIHILCEPSERDDVHILRFDGGASVFMSKYINENINIYKLSIHKTLSSAKIMGTVSIRFRREGDVILANGHHKSVKKLLNEAKLPPSARASLPFFCDEDGIFWIPGVAVRDGVECPNGDLLAGASGIAQSAFDCNI